MAGSLMVRAFLIAGLLATTAATAQTITLRATGSTTDTVRFNAKACGNDLSITWTSTVIVGLTGCTDPLTVWATEGECGDVAGAGDVRFTDVPLATVLTKRTDSFIIHLDQLPAFKYGDAGVVCGTDSVEKPHKICGAYKTSSGVVGSTCSVQHATALNVIYDTLPPVAATIDAVSPQDSALKLKFTASSDTFSVHFDARAQGDADFTERALVEVTTGSGATIKNLANGTTYDLRARSEDSAGNVSEPSEIVSATPRRTAGFWTQFRNDGGTEQGGCSAIHGFPVALAGGLWLLRRKRNR